MNVTEKMYQASWRTGEVCSKSFQIQARVGIVKFEAKVLKAKRESAL